MAYSVLRFLVIAFIVITSCMVLINPVEGYEGLSQIIAFYIICGLTGWLSADHAAICELKKQNQELCNTIDRLTRNDK